MKQEVAVKQDTTVGFTGGTWGAGGGEDFEMDDVVTPRIILLQKMSSLVDEGAGKAGEFVDSLEYNVLGDEKTPMELIIFDKGKKWKISDVSSSKAKWIRYEDHTSESSSLPWNFEENGIPMRRDKLVTYSCFVVKKGESISISMPYLISFSRTIMQSAKKIQTVIEKLRAQGKPSAAVTFLLTAKKETNDKGTFHVIDVKVGRDTTQDELATAFDWWERIQTGKTSLKEHDVSDEGDAPVGKVAKPKQTYTVDDADDEIQF
jgi:hypothetical protein